MKNNKNSIDKKLLKTACYVVSLLTSFTLYATSPTKNTSPPAMVLVGTYYTSTSNLPLAAASFDEGASWEYTLKGDNLPNNFGANADVRQSSCVGNNCVAVGMYEDPINSANPMVVVSHDGGKSWHYTFDKTNMPADFQIALNFNQVNCNATYCIASGYYSSTNGYLNPFVIKSTDAGDHWATVIDSSHPKLPSSFQESLNTNNALACAGETCIFASAYHIKTDNNTYPLIAVSHDSGSTWQYTVDDSSALAAGLSDIYDVHANCANKQCVIAYQASKITLLTSTDSGATWHTSLLNDQGNVGWPNATRLGGISVTDNAIVIVGQRYTHPFALESHDAGQTWNYTIDTEHGMPKGIIDGAFYDVSCQDKTCVSVGSYKILVKKFGFINYAMIATSHDNGLTWTYTLTNKKTPTDFLVMGALGRVSCTSTTCIASGSYGDSAFQSYPLAVVSHNRGRTWTYAVDKQQPKVLPEGYNGGYFSGASISNVSSYLSRNLSFLGNA